MQILKKEKRISMNELIEYLLNYAFDHEIGYKLVCADSYDPSLSLKKHNLMVINLNWHNQSELPFIIGHEIGHFILGDEGIMYYSSFSGQNSEEKSADLYALNLLYDYACNNGQYFEEPGQFIQMYGIPERMTTAAKNLFKHNDN